MKPFIAFTTWLSLGLISAHAQGVLDLPPRGRQDERAVTGGSQPIKTDAATPLPELIARLEGEWEEVPTGKAYWFGYTEDMYSIAAKGDQAIDPLLALARKTASAKTRYGCVLTLHLIGIDRKIVGRFYEKFNNPRARDALLDCLSDEKLRDLAMLMLIRDPWPSDVERLVEVMKSSKADCWTIVNGLFRYPLKDIPFHRAVPDALAHKPVAFTLPGDFCSDEFFWNILRGMKNAAGDALVLEDGLLQTKLWGNSWTGYGGGNPGPKEMPFEDILNNIVETHSVFSYTHLGNRIQYFVEGGIVHLCSSLTAKRRWLKWWDAQTDAYKKELSLGSHPAGLENEDRPAR